MINFLISGYYGFDNFGDEAILASIITSLKDNFNQSKITVFSSNPSSTMQVHSTEALNSFKLFDIIRGIKNTNVLISGGGSLLQDTTSIKSVIYYSSIILLAKIFKKKVFIYAQGIGPFRSFLSKTLVRFALKKADYITVRDFKSYDALENWDIKSQLTADPIWLIKPNPKPTKTVGIQLRQWKGIDSEFLNNLANCLNKHFPEYDYKFISLQDKNDLKSLQKLKDILLKNTSDKKINIVQYQGIKETIKEIEEVDYLISTRYHACLLGILANIPTAIINYDIKNTALAAQAGLPLIDISKQNFNEAFINLIESQDTIRETMKKACEENSKLAEQNIESLKSILNI